MFGYTKFILIAGTLLVSIAPLVQAEPAPGEVSTKSESLDELESRSVEKDFDVFFPDSSTTAVPSTPDAMETRKTRTDTGFDLFGEDVLIDVGDNLRNTDPFFDPAIGDGDIADSEKVRLLLELEE